MKYWIAGMIPVVFLGGGLVGTMFVHPPIVEPDTYVYLEGEKTPLWTDTTKRFVLLDEQVKRSVFQESTKANNMVLRLFEEVPAMTNLNFQADFEETCQSWGIVDSTPLSKELLEWTETTEEVVYESSFVTTERGDSLGFSHLLYVKLKQPDDIAKLEELARQHKVSIVGHNQYMPLWYTLMCTHESSGNALQVANQLFETGVFAAAEPDFLFHFRVTDANDEFFDKQWGLKNVGQVGGEEGIDINICEAWQLTTGSPDIRVAIIDHGIEHDHPDLPNVSPNSFDTNTGRPPSQIRGNHGTACAGIVGAARNNGIGVAGVAPDTTLLSISDSLGVGPNAQQRLANGLNWAWQNQADVISNSWGHEGLQSSLINDAIQLALTQGRNGKGCVVVFSAGNSDGSIAYPARSHPELLVVGAMSLRGDRKSLISRDPDPFWGSSYGEALDVVAPGILVPTTDLQGEPGYDRGDYTFKFKGTSSACPCAAGVAALILSVAPELEQQEVVEIIEQHAQKVGPYSYLKSIEHPHGNWHSEMGYGLVDAHACVLAALEKSRTDRETVQEDATEMQAKP